MRCPFCSDDDSQVKDSRSAEGGATIRRRRQCQSCGQRFTTFERVQLRELTVVKRSGRRVRFDREKLMRSISIALQKRPMEPDRLENMVSSIVRRLESEGDMDVPSDRVGKMVMEALANLDQVAYVRYASVYMDFSETKDFAKFIADEKLGK
ncbi:Ribonucleotide reductase transcriptional regulator NrdR [hydrothermal vent metagenome]|uniref:Ribonucleotide reductase transcriptional regulator NrdR n=1 Tax=hydrothermal vent metagenome TaxID=652676 RepID=A0A3B0RSR8_9ZZZZ